MAKVFCVEDDEGIRELVCCALRTGGYDAVGFESAEPMLERLGKETPSMIILDIMLPRTDGLTLLKQLKADSAYRNIPVIMVTAKTAEIDKVAGLEAGADDYISKPFGVMEFLARVKTVLRRTGSAPAAQEAKAPVRYKELTMNYSRRTAEVNGKELQLTYKEFELLYYLMLNNGLALSRDVIMDNIWGFDFEGETRTVDMHIKTIRQKLEALGCENYIKTVRGVGYKFGG